MASRALTKLKAEELLISDEITVDYLLSISSNSEDLDLRTELKKISNKIKIDKFNWKGGVISKKLIRSYSYDLEFGLSLYELFKFNQKYLISLKEAANPEFWSYLSIIVIPDLVSERWDLTNYARFYQQASRIWLYTLWWYIHLSWQGDIDSTRQILQQNSTDTIMNLVERVGRKGYNLEYSRLMMKEHSLIKHETLPKDDRLIFRTLMISHNLLSQTIEPSLYKNGIEDYLTKVFNMSGIQKVNGLYEAI